MLCKRDSTDPLLQELLDEQGMHLLTPARRALNVGELIVADGNGVARKAAYNSVFGVEPFPEVGMDGIPESFRFKSSAKLATKAGAGIAGAVLGAYGVDGGKMTSDLSRIGAASIELSIIAPSRLTLDNLDSMLDTLRAASSDVLPSFKDKRLYIVTDVFMAPGLRIAVYGNSNTLLRASTETAGTLNANVSLNVSAEQDGTYGYRASQPLVFGFSSREIFWQGGILIDSAPRIPVKLRNANIPEGSKCAGSQKGFAIITDDPFINIINLD